MLAARDGHIEVVDYLLNNGATVKQTDKNGDTALSMALDNDHSEVAGRLRKAGAKTGKKEAPPEEDEEIPIDDLPLDEEIPEDIDLEETDD